MFLTSEEKIARADRYVRRILDVKWEEWPWLVSSNGITVRILAKSIAFNSDHIIIIDSSKPNAIAINSVYSVKELAEMAVAYDIRE